MGNLYFIKQDHIFQLCGISNHCPLAHQGIAADKRTVSHFRAFPDDTGTGDGCCRSDFGIPGDPDILSLFLIFLFRKRISKLHKKCSDFRQNLPGKDFSLKKLRRDRLPQIVKFLNRNSFHRSTSFLSCLYSLFLIFFISYKHPHRRQNTAAAHRTGACASHFPYAAPQKFPALSYILPW